MSTTRRKTLLTVIALATAACIVCGISDGIKNNYGIMLQAIISNSGLTYASVSLVLAVSQLFYGMIQPFFGVLAERKSNTLTLIIGVGLTLAGLLLMPYCKSTWSLMACLGILLPAGTGALSYAILIGSITPKIPANTVSLVAGFVNASSGIGNAALSPIIQALLARGGISAAALALAVPTALLLPLCLYVGKRNVAQVKAAAHGAGRFSDAFANRDYRLLVLGFFTCGFHMALISNHLPSQITSYGISAQTAAWAFSLYGIITMAGSVFSGWMCDRHDMKNVLGTYYGSRMVITLAFLLLPKVPLTIFVFAAFLGLTGAATVPPVSCLINRDFGAGRLASLYGFAFFVHQIGGFFGAWLGGIFFESFGGYVQIWCVDMVFCTIAAAASYAIRPEKASSAAA